MKIKSILVFAMLVLLIGCSQNERTRCFGGTQQIALNQGETLINATWKDVDLWLLVAMPDGSKEFREYSAYGTLNGKVIVHQWGTK